MRAGVVFAAAILFSPLLIPLVTGRMIVTMDLAWFHIPLRYLYGHALAAGDSILWTPALFRGFYLHGEGQVGAMHPLHLVLYGLLPLPVALGIELVTIYAFAFAGMRLCLRMAGLGGPAATTGGLLYAFSGFNLLHLNHLSLIAVASHLPWMVAAAERCVSAASGRGQAAAFAGLAALVGSAILLGFPQFVLVALLCTVACAAVRAAMLRAWMRLPLVAAAVLLGVAIGGAQLLPTLDFFRGSNRSEPMPGFALTFSLHPLNLLQLWSPYVFPRRVYVGPSEEFLIHEYSTYNGAFCTVALFWVALRRIEARRRAIVWSALAVCAIATLLALGRYGGLYPYLLHVPFVDRFRAPARFIALVHFGLAALAALVVDDLARIRTPRTSADWRNLWPLAVPVLASALTALAAIAWFGDLEKPSQYAPSASRLSVGLALLACAAALVAGAARGWRLALAVLPVFAALDIALWGYLYVRQPPPMTFAQLASTANVPADAPPGTVLNNPRIFESNMAVLRDFRVTLGYAGLTRPRMVRNEDHVRRLSGAEWTASRGEWRRTTDAMPPARLVSDVRTTDNVARDIEGIDISRTALVDRALPAFAGPPGTAQVSTNRPGRIVVDVQSEAAALLVLTETYDAGWTANDGERELLTVSVYGDYLGAVVPGGSRTVTFTFAPAAVRYGMGLSLSGVVATALAAFALRRRGVR